MEKLNIRAIATVIAILVCIANSVQAQEKATTQKEKRVGKEQMAALDSLQSKSGEKIAVSWNLENSTPTMISGKLAGAELLKKVGSYEQASIDFLKNSKKLLKLGVPEDEFKVSQKLQDDLGNTHVKLDQYYRGIRVFGAQLIVHFNQKGEVYLLNGRYSSSFDISLTPTISQAQAIQIATTDAKNSPDSFHVEQLIYTNSDMNDLHLAWSVHLLSKSHPTQQYVVDS